MRKDEMDIILDKHGLDYKYLFEEKSGELYFNEQCCLSNLCNSKLIVDEYDLGGIVLIYSESYGKQLRTNDSVLLVLKNEPRVSSVTVIDNEELDNALTDEVLSELHRMNLTLNNIIGNEMETVEIDVISAHRRVTIKEIAK